MCIWVCGVFICGDIYVCVCKGAHIHKQARGGQLSGPYIITPCLSPLRQHLSLNPKLVDYLNLLARPARSEDPRVSTPLVLEELLHTLSHLACLSFMFMLESQTQVLLLLHLSHLPSPHHDILFEDKHKTRTYQRAYPPRGYERADATLPA